VLFSSTVASIRIAWIDWGLVLLRDESLLAVADRSEMGHQGGGKYGEDQRPNCDCLLFGTHALCHPFLAVSFTTSCVVVSDMLCSAFQTLMIPCTR
jgi:hypothetical protein